MYGVLGISRGELAWMATSRFGKCGMMFRVDGGYRTNTNTSFRGDSMTRKSFVKQFKNTVALSRSK